MVNKHSDLRIEFRALLILLFLGFSLSALAQDVKSFQKTEEKIIKRKGQNNPHYDNKRLHYGFFLALNRSTFKVKPSQWYVNQVEGDSIPLRVIGINPQAFAGFTTGFILNVRMHEYWDARILPTVSFYQRYVQFRLKPAMNSRNYDSLVTELKQSTFSFIEMSFLAKYKSIRRNNTRMYMVGGIKPAIEVGAKRKEIGDDRLRSTTLDLTIEYGLGFDFYYPLFKLSPEIRFSHGMRNLLSRDPNPYSQSLKRMSTHTVTLYFYFE